MSTDFIGSTQVSLPTPVVDTYLRPKYVYMGR